MPYTREIPPVPPIPGWEISHDENTLIADRLTKLTEYQVEYGALPQVYARTAGELWMLCDAQTRLAERLHTAEMVHVAQVAAATRRAREMVESLGGVAV